LPWGYAIQEAIRMRIAPLDSLMSDPAVPDIRQDKVVLTGKLLIITRHAAPVSMRATVQPGHGRDQSKLIGVQGG
jgi:hypothetical protein